MDRIKVGLEVHCQLTSLRTKLFCGCSSDYRSKESNSLVCPVCLGLPGSLPVFNKKALDYAIIIGLALNCKISERFVFYRKNYYYPDLPKNFQISQWDRAGGVPLAAEGHVDINVDHKNKDIRIRKVHLEEDPAKIVYAGSISTSPYALIDYNRSGVALTEVVTEPDMSSPAEARLFLDKLRSILEHLGVCDGGLEGAMRCDANVSLAGGQRVEIKNISSHKEVERALNFEILRQRNLIANGQKVEMETRHWDEVRRVTISLRTKETEQDYRYFPEPDLVPIIISDEQISYLKDRMPELPDARRDRFVKQYGLPEYGSSVLTSSKSLADFFEACVKLYPNSKIISNWIITDYLRALHDFDIEVEDAKLSPTYLIDMIKLIDDGTISGKIAKSVLPKMIEFGRSPLEIVKEAGLTRIASNDAIEQAADKVFKEYPKAVQDALVDERAVNYLVGQLMKLTAGRADPKLANQIVKQKLSKAKKDSIR